MTEGKFSGEQADTTMDYMSAGGLKDILGGNTIQAGSGAGALIGAEADGGGGTGAGDKGAATSSGDVSADKEGGKEAGGVDTRGRLCSLCSACYFNCILFGVFSVVQYLFVVFFLR